MLWETVVVELSPRDDDDNVVDLGMKVVKRREPLRSSKMPPLSLWQPLDQSLYSDPMWLWLVGECCLLLDGTRTPVVYTCCQNK